MYPLFPSFSLPQLHCVFVLLDENFRNLCSQRSACLGTWRDFQHTLSSLQPRHARHPTRISNFLELSYPGHGPIAAYTSASIRLLCSSHYSRVEKQKELGGDELARAITSRKQYQPRGPIYSAKNSLHPADRADSHGARDALRQPIGTSYYAYCISYSSNRIVILVSHTY